MVDPEGLLQAAERVSAVLCAYGVEPLVIGGAALAAHGYVRFTEDLDLGVTTDPVTLHLIARSLSEAGFEVALREPDAADPLGGVIDVTGPFGVVQIVNYGGRFPAVIETGLATADSVVRPGSRLRVVPLPHLVALKLYAGGMKSRADIVEVLVRNPTADTAAIRDLCLQWRLGGLDPLIEEARSGPIS